MIISAEGGVNEASEPCLERPSIVLSVAEVPSEADCEKVDGKFHVDTESGEEGMLVFTLDTGEFCKPV